MERDRLGPPLAELTAERQVHRLIEVAVEGFRDEMADDRRAQTRRSRSDAGLQSPAHRSPSASTRSSMPRSRPNAPPRRRATISAARGSAMPASGRCSSSSPRRRRTTAPTSAARRCASSPSATRSRIWRSAGCARAGLRSLHPQGQPARRRAVRLLGRRRARPRSCRRHHRRRARRRSVCAFPRSGNARP